MYIQVLKKSQNNKIYTSTLIRESYRDAGKVKHRTIANISKLPDACVQQLRLVLAGKGAFVNSESIKREDNREYGASNALLALAKDIGLDKVIYSQKTAWRDDCLAMIVGRLLYQGSKLSLVNLYSCTSLWQQCGYETNERPDVNRIYNSMDMLSKRQSKIQKSFAKKHLQDRTLILYDMTNVWLEGEYNNSELAAYGISKEKKHGYKQISIALLTDKNGCPIKVEVFRGNIGEQVTVEEQVRKLAEEDGVENIIFAGDRGILTPKRIKEVCDFGFNTVSALTHPQIFKLIKNKVIQPGLFDEKTIIEIDSEEKEDVEPAKKSNTTKDDADQSSEKKLTKSKPVRYLLCKNPLTAKKETSTRLSLLEATDKSLSKIAQVKRIRKKEDVCVQIGRVFEKYKMRKFYDWKVTGKGKLTWEKDQNKIEIEESIDGCYVIRADMSKDILNKEEAVSAYKSLINVERAFRALKTTSLEMRPIHHKTDDRIRAHIFLCMLAYYLQWHAIERLKPLFKQNQKGAQYKNSFAIIIEKLKAVSICQLKIGDIEIGSNISELNSEQKKITSLLQNPAVATIPK